MNNQESLRRQLVALVYYANMNGLFDAANYVAQALKEIDAPKCTCGARDFEGCFCKISPEQFYSTKKGK